MIGHAIILKHTMDHTGDQMQSRPPRTFKFFAHPEITGASPLGLLTSKPKHESLTAANATTHDKLTSSTWHLIHPIYAYVKHALLLWSRAGFRAGGLAPERQATGDGSVREHALLVLSHARLDLFDRLAISRLGRILVKLGQPGTCS